MANYTVQLWHDSLGINVEAEPNPKEPRSVHGGNWRRWDGYGDGNGW